jgi:hypothetical protein
MSRCRQRRGSSRPHLGHLRPQPEQRDRPRTPVTMPQPSICMSQTTRRGNCRTCRAPVVVHTGTSPELFVAQLQMAGTGALSRSGFTNGRPARASNRGREQGANSEGNPWIPCRVRYAALGRGCRPQPPVLCETTSNLFFRLQPPLTSYAAELPARCTQKNVRSAKKAGRTSQ